LSKKEKLVTRLKQKPKDFEWDEMANLLSHLGYVEIKLGKTVGSRRAFFHEDLSHILRFHKPHPGNILKRYQLDYLIDELSKKRLI
jgi:hypothetical protein